MKLNFIDLNIEEYDLHNGLKVYVFNDKYSTKYIANFITFFGSNDLVNEQVPAGTAHFLEHVMFAKKDGDYFNEYDKYNASANAFTTYNFTNYLFSCDKYFNENLQILIDLVTSTYFTKDIVGKEKQIINEEILMYEKQPLVRLQKQLFDNLCLNTNYKFDICGTINSISNLNKDILESIHNEYYTYDNQVLLLYGNFMDVDLDKLLNNNLPKQNVLKDKVVKNNIEQFKVNKKESVIYDEVELNSAITAFKFNRISDENYLITHSLNVFLDYKFNEINEKFYKMINNNDLPSLTYSIINKQDILAFYIKYEGEDVDGFHKPIVDYVTEKIDKESIALFLKKYKAEYIYQTEDLEKLYNNLIFKFGEQVDLVKFYDKIDKLTSELIINTINKLFENYDTTYVALKRKEEADE